MECQVGLASLGAHIVFKQGPFRGLTFAQACWTFPHLISEVAMSLEFIANVEDAKLLCAHSVAQLCNVGFQPIRSGPWLVVAFCRPFARATWPS